MKKRKIYYLILFLGACFFYKNVEAKTFIEEINYNYQFKVVWQPYNATVYRNFAKMIDEDGSVFYDVTPSNSIWNKENFVQKEFSTTSETLEKMAQYIYFGYGYHGNYEDIEYYATQMLIYRLFPKYEINVIENYAVSSYLDAKIKEIEDRIVIPTFPLQDFSTQENFYFINDEYIIQNFDITGENISVLYENAKVSIQFLNNQEKYILQFKPKKCEAEFFESDQGHGLLRMNHLCEKEYSVVVNHEAKKEDVTVIIPTETEEEKKPTFNEEKTEFLEKQEPISGQETFLVSVPNTNKTSFKGILFLFLVFLLIKKKHF